MTQKNGKVTLALVGQPNTGKSTVFNQLTGSHQHVGNWPGKTVEQKTGFWNYQERTYHIVDLPGTYSLTANSTEEIITRDYILNENPDAVIVMVDASQLERTMYLLAEAITFPTPVILALNMIDVAEQEGRTIDVPTLQHHLDMPVVPMVATKKDSINDLMNAIDKLIFREDICENPQPEWLESESSLIDSIKEVVQPYVSDVYPINWAVLKLIEEDEIVTSYIKEKVPVDGWKSIQEKLSTIDDGPMLIAGARYQWIQKMLEHVVSRPVKDKSAIRRGKFDKIATHPVWGVFLSILVFILSFAAAMIVAMPLMGAATSSLPALIESIHHGIPNAPDWFIAMLADGLVPGVGMALSFLGFMVGVFLVIGIIEDVGYMARVAFVADRFMNRIGLQGKSFMPMFSSFGCNITGVLGSRVVDTWQQRLMTLVMAPIIPCLAVWGVTGFFGTLFFGSRASFVTLALIISLFLWLAFTGYLFRKFVFKEKKSSGMIMELPPYHKPNWKTIFRFTWLHTKSFLVRGFTLVAAASLVIWVFSYLPNGDIETSYLAQAGRFFEPVSLVMGLDWRLFVALIASIASKEAAIASLGVIYGLPAGMGSTSLTGLIMGAEAIEQTAVAGVLQSAISPASALAFIFAVFFSIPCLGTMGAIYSETKSWKWTLGSATYYTLTSFLAGFLAYRIGLLLF